MIGAAAMIVMLLLAGSGFDLGRAYITRSRLQQACDAGVLAGRKAQGRNTYDDAAQQVAQRYFNFNFQGTPQGVDNVSFTSVSATGGVVSAHAATTLNTTLMRIFGYQKFDLSADCGAAMGLMQDTDVMMVLDTTASMQDPATSGDTISKIDALKAAAKNFYKTTSISTAAGAQIRYGFMPFSETVNVGRDLKPEWVASHWLYPSRRRNHRVSWVDSNQDWWADDGLNDIAYNGYDTWTPDVNQGSNCTVPPNTDTYTYEETSPHDHSLPVEQTFTFIETRSGTQYFINKRDGNCYLSSHTFYGWSHTGTKLHHLIPGSSWTSNQDWWDYSNNDEDVSYYRSGVGTDQWMSHADRVINGPDDDHWTDWGGCIEERYQVPTAGGIVPAGVTSADVNAVPTSDESTQWGIWVPGFVFVRDKAGWWGDVAYSPDWMSIDPVLNLAGGFWGPESANCPNRARKLSVMPDWDYNGFVDSLGTNGYTYLDIGLLWGARYISPNGIFAAENQDRRPDQPTKRHLILMTDGQMEVRPGIYGGYGLEGLIQRRTPVGVSPTADQLTTVASNNFSALCDVVKGQNITIWVIAFGTDLSPMLRNCASPDHAYMANNATELDKAFQDIAGKMAGLQLVS